MRLCAANCGAGCLGTRCRVEQRRVRRLSPAGWCGNLLMPEAGCKR